LKEDTPIKDKNKFIAAWFETFKYPFDPLLGDSKLLVDRMWGLISNATKMKKGTRVETSAGAVQKVLIGFRALGFDVVHLKAAGDRLDNMRTVGVKGEDRRREIAEETYEVHCRIGDIIGIRQYVRTCVDLCAPILNPGLPDPFRDLVDSRMHVGCLDRRFLLEDKQGAEPQTITVRDYLTSFLQEKEEVVRVQFDPARLADFVMEHDEPLSRLSLKDLRISSLDPLFETVVLVKPGTDIHRIITHIIHRCSEPSDRKYTEDANHAGEFAHLGTRLKIHSRQFGILVFRINDTVSEARSKRGVSPIRSEDPRAADLPSDEMRAAVSRILRETQGDRIERTIPLARQLLLRPNMTVFTPRGDPKSLPRGSRGPDFAASVHPDFLRGFDGFIAHDSEKRFRKIDPFDPLEEGMQIEIVPGERFKPDHGWLLLCETERARVALKKILPQGFDKDYIARIAALFGLPREPLFREVSEGNREPLNMLAEGLFKEKSAWHIRVELPDEPGILRAFLGEFEKQGINVNRFLHIPQKPPALHVIRMEIQDRDSQKTPFEIMKVLLKLSYHYRVAVLPRSIFRRSLQRAGDFLRMVGNTLQRDLAAF
jgi:hypothetical protein